jgi:hypothetical protein
MEQFPTPDTDGDGTPTRCTCTECLTEGQHENERPTDCIHYTPRH